MGSKLGATLFALVFAIPFGGIGAGAAWIIGNMFNTARLADDWVVVQATVSKADLSSSTSRGSTSYGASGTYSYTFEGKQYTGTRLGVSPMESGSDNIGDWQESMAAFLDNARTTGKTIPVFVNPDNPSEAVVDREVRWPLVLFAGTFALVFGGVGVGALVAIVAIWRSSGVEGTEIRKARARKGGSTARSEAWKAAGFLWVFAFFWNAISWPITFLAVPEMIANEEWVGLLVLLFPLIGVLVLWGAISTTIGLLKRGDATLALQPESPRAGAAVNGSLTFARGVRNGEAFKVRLACNRTEKRGGTETTTLNAWSREVTANATPTGEGARVAFKFDVPVDVPTSQPARAGERTITHAWRIEVTPARSSMAAYSFPIEMQDAEPSAFGRPQAPTAAAAAAAAPTISDQSLIQLLGPKFAADLSESQRASFAAMSAKQQAITGGIVRTVPKIKNVVIGIVVFFIAIQILQFVLAVMG